MPRLFRRTAPDSLALTASGRFDPRLRTLTASATRLNLRNRKQTRQMKILRQGWQEDAWGYYDSIGELRYATEFLANCTARMKLYPAAYPRGGEEDNPIPLSEVGEMPEQVVSACAQAMADLGNGKLAIRDLLHSASTNKTIAGEMFLLGRTDPETGKETWTVRSVDELVIYEDKYKLREAPVDPQGILGWIDLDPQTTVISRIWQSHPRFRILAISPLRSILDDCENLLIHRRTIRAVGRSRLAGPGLLLWPEEASIKVPIGDDPEADPVMQMLFEGMMTPVSEEGTAAALVPILLRLPGDAIDKVKHLDFSKLLDPASAAIREELVGIIATGLDLPKEVITGKADLNHWTAWQIDDDTFRHHVEPHVIGVCDGLTSGYLHPYLRTLGIPEYWVERCLFWYDPTELVTHPDRTKDAWEAHDRLLISDAAARREAGFEDGDEPSKQELQVRLLEKMRTWPPNLVMAFLHAWDPSLVAPAMAGPPAIPGISPKGVEVAETPEPAAPAEDSITPAPRGDATPKPHEQGPPPAPPITASAGGQHARLSRKLAQVDRDLRSKLQTAANAAMLRQLERAGAKLRPKVAKDETLRAKIAHRPNERVSAILGKDAVTAAGFTSEQLVGSDWSTLRTQFYDWTSAAQEQAVTIALRLGEMDAESDAAQAASAAMAAGRDAAWTELSGQLSKIGENLLYNPDPNVGPGDWADLNPDTIVPTGTIRAALGIAGGGSGETTAMQAVGQIGTGATIEELLSSPESQVEQASYEWSHASTTNNPFEPHEDLDGAQFDSFEAEALANRGDFPDNAFYFPGDHGGCHCDAILLWVPLGQSRSAQLQTGGE
jgi:hypothetical protein